MTTPRRFTIGSLLGHNDVQRIRRYTEVSLYGFIWVFIVMYGGATLTRGLSALESVIAVVVLAALGVAATRVVTLALAQWPTPGVPWREPRMRLFLAVAVVATAWALWMDGGAEDHMSASFSVIICVAWSVAGFKHRWLHWVMVAAAGVLGFVVSRDLAGALVASMMAGFFVIAMQSSLWMLGVVLELDRARRTEADLAVAQERLRFADDVHDVLGRHLSVIAVQAELAAALIAKDDPRAVERVAEIRSSAHEALREARELARGYRPLDLGREISGARELLASAGIQSEGHGDLLAAGLPQEFHEPVARVVREAVTNILRHSKATKVRLTCEATRDGRTVVEISNDAPLPPNSSSPAATPGSGLASLAAHLADHGAVLEQISTTEFFALRLTLPTLLAGSPAGADHDKARRG